MEDQPVNDLVQRLAKEQDVEASLRPEQTLALFKAAVDRGYVHVKFVKTGTELGVRLDPRACDLSKVDFAKGAGEIQVVGGLILNYVRVRCHATINLETLRGKGYLEIIEEVTPAQLAQERAARASS